MFIPPYPFIPTGGISRKELKQLDRFLFWMGCYIATLIAIIAAAGAAMVTHLAGVW